MQDGESQGCGARTHVSSFGGSASYIFSFFQSLCLLMMLWWWWWWWLSVCTFFVCLCVFRMTCLCVGWWYSSWLSRSWVFVWLVTLCPGQHIWRMAWSNCKNTDALVDHDRHLHRPVSAQPAGVLGCTLISSTATSHFFLCCCVHEIYIMFKYQNKPTTFWHASRSISLHYISFDDMHSFSFDSVLTFES